VAGGDAIAFVGTDDYSIALDTAPTPLKAMGGKGNLVVFEGPDTVPTAVGRLRGFKDALKEFPEVAFEERHVRPAGSRRSGQGAVENESR
jgi:ribose transport system substrate-binding protein